MGKKAYALMDVLGHTEIDKALKYAVDMQSALRVICTWSECGVLNSEHVTKLIKRTLKIDGRGNNARIRKVVNSSKQGQRKPA